MLNLTPRYTWAKRISAEWTDACAGMREAIFAIGRHLIEAKEELDHGEFLPMVENDLPFTKRTAQMFMEIARDARLSKAKSISLLPPHWGTLYKITRLEDETFDRLIDDGTISPDCTFAEINKVLRLERVTEDEKRILKLKPTKDKFRTLVLDPAWDYVNLSLGARAKADYAKQGLQDLREMDVKRWAEDECHLYCWATNNYLYEAMKLVAAWGFQYRLTLAWIKPPPFGMGSYYRHTWEPCVFATLGKTTTRKAAASIATHFDAPRGKHSEKPEKFYEIVRAGSYPPYGEGNQREPRKDFKNLFEEAK